MTQQVQNILAKRIDTAGAMISYDDACKRVLSNKTVLAWIMKTCIPEYKLMDIDEIAEKYIEGEPEISGSAVHMDETKEFIHGMQNESPSITEGTVTFDIKFRAIIPDLTDSIDMIINIEAQNDFYPGYPIVKRGVYYACRLISDQYGTVFDRSEYQKIRKVASIWICPNPPEYRANTISGYSLTEQNIVGDTRENNSYYDLILVVMICLGERRNEQYSGLIRMLDVLLSQNMELGDKKKALAEEFGIPMTKSLEGDVENMCNLSKSVFNNGFNSGFDNGFVNGQENALAESVKELMKTTKWDIDTCMDAINISSEKRDTIKAVVLGVTSIT